MTGTIGKRALIVDDSKSARAFLGRVLEKYGIDVETAEDAEQAITHLAHSRPDVIFMDHLMPGMDGFQAVQAIKNNPRTATIPIMMYTSQEGELYLGQARALGAMGVLPKQVKPAEVSTVLYQLGILPDRRRNHRSGFEPGNDAAVRAIAGAAVAPPAGATDLAAAAVAAGITATADDAASVAFEAAPEAGGSTTPAPLPPDLRPMVESVVREQLADLRRQFGTLLDDQSMRLLGDMRAAVIESTVQPASAETAALLANAAPRFRVLPWAIAAAASVAAAALAGLWWNESQSTATLAARLVEAQQSLANAQAVAATQPERLDATPASTDTLLQMPALAVAGQTPVTTAAKISPGATADSEYVRRVPYGEVAISGDRLELVRGLLAELVEKRFRGAVKITSFPGRFCLSGNSAQGFAPAADSLAFAKCDAVGNPFDDALAPAQRESLALANLIGSIRQQTSGAITVDLGAGTESSRVSVYPAESVQLNAGQWNRAAEDNNRLEIRLQPAR